jgi:putative ABC transport system permease protein
MFANSEYETKTSTEKAFVQAFANQVGDIGSILVAITVAVFFTIVLVAANTMAQSIRERVGELAVLKTLGFSNGLVLSLVLAESILLAVVGGGLGLLLGWLFTLGGDPTGGFLPAFFIPGRDLAIGVALVLLLGLVAGAMPATTAMRLRIVDALRRN